MSESWNECSLNQLFSIKHGFAFDGKYFATEGEHILLTPGNFHDAGGFKLKSKEKFFTGNFAKEYLLPKDSLIVAMTEQAEGLLGSSAIIPESGRFLHNQRLGLITDLNEDRIDKYFLYYLFNSRAVRTQIRATATGTKVRHTSPTRIGEVTVSIPDVQTQRKIASIMSAYDDLIENNTRRIAILEEMAQAIYREWFVHFRFPGHENVKLVDSPLGQMPDGWEVVKLSTIADVNGKSIKKGNAPESINYIDIKSVSTGRIDEVRSMPFSEAPGRARRIVTHGDVVWSTVRPVRRSYSIILDPLPDTIASTGFAVLTAKSAPFAFVYFATTTDEFANYLVNHATGSAYPAVNGKDFDNADIILPPTDVLGRFDDTVRDTLVLGHRLLVKNNNLRATRDLLLPKLISGKLDVEKLDIDVGLTTEALEEATA